MIEKVLKNSLSVFSIIFEWLALSDQVMILSTLQNLKSYLTQHLFNTHTLHLLLVGNIPNYY